MSEFIGVEASVKIVPDTTQFRAQLLTQLKAATTGVVLSETQLASATNKASTATARQTVLQNEATAAAKAEAAANRAAAKAAAEHAAAQNQLSRGAGATLLSLGGARGATLAAGSEFLIGAAAVTLLAKSVRGAIEDEENLFRISRVLGDELGKGSQKWSETLANSFGLADDQALHFQSTIANVLHNVGLTNDQIAPLSKRLVELGADMAAFAHVSPDVTLRALQLAVTGNVRAIRPFVGGIRQADVTLRAFQQTGKDSVRDLTQLERTNALLSIIFEKTANQVGAAADRQHDLAQQARILNANLSNLGDDIGHILVPPLRLLTQILNNDVAGIKLFTHAVGEAGPPLENTKKQATFFGQALHLIGTEAKLAAGGMIGILGAAIPLNETVQDLAAQTKALEADPLRHLPDALLAAVGPINTIDNLLHFLADSFGEAGNAARTFAQQLQISLSTAQHQLLDLQFQGATSAAQIQNLQRQVGLTQDIIKHPGAGGTAAREKARQDRNAAQAQIKSIRDADAAAAKAAASAAEAAAKKAQAEAEAARRAHDQAILTRQQFEQGDLEIAAAHAQHTKSLAEDLGVQRQQLALIEKQIVDAAKILDRTLRLQTIQQLTLDRETAQNAIAQTKAQIAQNIRDRKVTAAEAAVQSAQLDAELADTLNKPKAQIAALQRENKALEEERKLWTGNVLKLKEIRNQIAANNAEIKKIRGETDNRADELARLEFTFLQTQSGFAGTLLSNLIPHDVAAGTVGGAAINTTTGAFDSIGPAGFATAAHRRPGQDLSDATQTKASARGASMSQMATLITINRHMLQAILRLSSQRAHPEATYQTYTGAQDLNVATAT